MGEAKLEICVFFGVACWPPARSPMLLIKQYIDKDLSGSVTLRPQEDEDMWHAYNLIQEGDELRGTAVR